MKEGINKPTAATLIIIERTGLAIIALATIVAAGQEVSHMVANLKVTLADILLLFIYLEIFAMIGIYLKSHRLPIRMPIYIAIVALARYLILDIKEMEDWRMLAVSVSIVLLAFTVLLHRFGHIHYPYPSSYDEDEPKQASHPSLKEKD